MWRRELLPGSETFIRSQIDGLLAWEGLSIGMTKVESPVARESDHILYGDRVGDRILLKLFVWTRYSGLLYRKLKELKPDLVHAHFAMDGILISPLCRILNIPYVVSIYGVDVTAMPVRKGFRGVLYRRQLASMFKHSAKVLAVSGYLADAARELGAPPEKVLVHRLGINLPEVPPARGMWRWDVLVVGRLVEKKGIDDLIAAVAQVASTGGTQVRLAVVGDGPMRETLREKATTLGVDTAFLGAQTPESVLEIMRHSRILVVPSKRADNGDSEGLPMILLEAAASGVPIAATRHSGIPEFITHDINGLLSEERDVEGLAFNIERLLSDDSLATALAESAYERVIEEYNIEGQARRLESIYEQVVKVHR